MAKFKRIESVINNRNEVLATVGDKVEISIYGSSTIVVGKISYISQEGLAIAGLNTIDFKDISEITKS